MPLPIPSPPPCSVSHKHRPLHISRVPPTSFQTPFNFQLTPFFHFVFPCNCLSSSLSLSRHPPANSSLPFVRWSLSFHLPSVPTKHHRPATNHTPTHLYPQQLHARQGLPLWERDDRVIVGHGRGHSPSQGDGVAMRGVGVDDQRAFASRREVRVGSQPRRLAHAPGAQTHHLHRQQGRQRTSARRRGGRARRGKDRALGIGRGAQTTSGDTPKRLDPAAVRKLCAGRVDRQVSWTRVTCDSPAAGTVREPAAAPQRHTAEASRTPQAPSCRTGSNAPTLLRGACERLSCFFAPLQGATPRFALKPPCCPLSRRLVLFPCLIVEDSCPTARTVTAARRVRWVAAQFNYIRCLNRGRR